VGVTLVSDLSDLSDKMGAPVFALTGYAVASHVIPRGLPAAVWFGSGEDVPLGWLLLIGAPNKNLVFLVFLVFLVSAARLALQTSAVIQNLGADLPKG